MHAWLRENRVPLCFMLLVLLMVPMRGLWAPDEPDFAQCVREMRHDGHWLLPYLNGEPYNEKPILFYWLMKVSAIVAEKLTGGLGFTNGISAWALRLPSVLAAVLFVWAFYGWATRFAGKIMAEPGTLVLATTPIWVWQAQFIQIDMLFAALVAWSWLAWLAGYLILRGEAPANSPYEHGTWFIAAYISLGLAFLAKGPLAVVLSAALLLAFLAWQRDWKILGQMRLGWGLAIMLAMISPWYIAAGIEGGATYAYNMIIHQNLDRALSAWDHIQPWWRYANYVAVDFMPWTLLLPALALLLYKDRARYGAMHRLHAMHRFLLLAVALPVLLLSCSQSKQGKYVLMIYPFLSLLMGDMLLGLINETQPSRRAGRFGALLTGFLCILGLADVAAVFFGAGGDKLQENISQYRVLVGVLSLTILFCAGLFAWGAALGRGRYFARDMGITLGIMFLMGGTWGFRLLEPQKGYWGWTKQVAPKIEGKHVNFWQTIRSGAMIYTKNLTMPELTTAQQLEDLPSGSYLVATKRVWPTGEGGLTDAHRGMFRTVHMEPVGGGGFILLQKIGPEP